MRADRTPDPLGFVRSAELIAVPWRNGGGLMREVALTVVEGEGIDLRIDVVEHVLGLHEPLSCDGAGQTWCSLLTGPVRDPTVMTRNDGSWPQSPSGTFGNRADRRRSAVVARAHGSRAELHPLDAAYTSGAGVRLLSGSGLAVAAFVLVVSWAEVRPPPIALRCTAMKWLA